MLSFFLADKLFINEILNQPRYKINHFCAKKLIIEYAIKQSNYVLFVKFFNNSSAEWLKSNAFHFLYLSAKYKQFNCSTNIISLIDVNALFENNFSSLVKLIEISKDDIFFLNNDERIHYLIHKNIYSILIESLDLNASHSLKFFFENFSYDIDRLTQSQKAYIINKSFKINKFEFLNYIITNNSYFFISSFKEWILDALMLLDYHKKEESFLIKKSHISKQTFILKLFSNHEIMDQLDILLSNDPSYFCAINNDNLFFENLIQKANNIYMQSRKKSPSRLAFI